MIPNFMKIYLLLNNLMVKKKMIKLLQILIVKILKFIYLFIYNIGKFLNKKKIENKNI